VRQRGDDPVPAPARVEDGVEARGETAPARLREDRRERLAVELLEHERAGHVQPPAAVEQLRVELLAGQPSVRAGQMEERPLAVAGDERDRRRGLHRQVAQDAAPLDAALVEQPEDEVPEGVGPDLPDRGRGHSEPDERARGVERAAAAAQRDLLDEGERAPGGRCVDRPGEDVRHQDAETDDLDRHGTYHAIVNAGRGTIRPPFSADSCAQSPTQVQFAERRASGNGGLSSSRAETNSCTRWGCDPPWPAS
jgi:hypothetical protein